MKHVKRAWGKAKRLIGLKRAEAQAAVHLSIAPSSRILVSDYLDFRVKAERRTYVTIGERSLVNARFTFETERGKVTVGNNTHLGGVHFICRSQISVGNDVTMAWGITIYDHDSHSLFWDHRCNDNEQCYSDYFNHGGNNTVNKDWSHVASSPITIEDKVWIGFNVIVLKGVTIGEGAVVGAGSVVTKDIPPFTLAAGNPATVRKALR